MYGHDPQVIFDLFNEPRTYSPGMPLAQTWQLWHDGGVFRGVSYPFGMAQLARYVRSTLGAQNLFWIEGPDISSSFAGMMRAGALLKVSGMCLRAPPGALHDSSRLGRRLRLPSYHGIAPVVDGEWTNYEPRRPRVPRCRPLLLADAPIAVPPT